MTHHFPRTLARSVALGILVFASSSALAETTMKVGGRIHFDTAVIEGDDAIGGLPDGTQFRRARLAASGKMDGLVEWKAQLDFAKGAASFKDMYLGLTRTPLFGMALRVGQFHQPMGLEVLTSSNYITFIERSGPAALVPDRQSGIMLHRKLPAANGTLAVSAFQAANSQGKATGDGVWNTAARVTVAPWHDADAGRVLHLGVAGSLRKNQDRMLEVDLAPESNLAPDFATVEVPADTWTAVGAEAALTSGAVSVQGEFVTLASSAPDGMDMAPEVTLTSYYVYLSWFLTGEHRPYKGGKFGRVKPEDPYDAEGGSGAVEVAARLSGSDFEDAGKAQAITLAANWYLNSKSRVMLNFVRSEGTDTALAGVMTSLIARFQIDF